MSINHFVVSQRDSVWQFSSKGDVVGPFTTKDAAIEAAITEAGKAAGPDVEVLVRDADLRTQTIWRNGQINLSDEETDKLATDLERETDA